MIFFQTRSRTRGLRYFSILSGSRRVQVEATNFTAEGRARQHVWLTSLHMTCFCFPRCSRVSTGLAPIFRYDTFLFFVFFSRMVLGWCFFGVVGWSPPAVLGRGPNAVNIRGFQVSIAKFTDGTAEEREQQVQKLRTELLGRSGGFGGNQSFSKTPGVPTWFFLETVARVVTNSAALFPKNGRRL